MGRKERPRSQGKRADSLGSTDPRILPLAALGAAVTLLAAFGTNLVDFLTGEREPPSTPGAAELEIDADAQFVAYGGVFTRAECASIIKQALELPAEEAALLRGLSDLEGAKPSHSADGRQDQKERRSAVRWLDGRSEAFGFVYDRMKEYVKHANGRSWHFAEVGATQRIQMALYDGAQQGYYDWHTDLLPSLAYRGERLLSITVQLSAPAGYGGGEVQLGTRNATMGQGDTLVFPSSLCHKVHPVTWGQRYSLVGWFLGGDNGWNAHASAEAQLAHHQQYWQAAEASYAVLAATLPQLEAGHTSLGLVTGMGKRYSESIAHYDRAVALPSRWRHTLANRGKALLEMGRQEEALASYNDAVGAASTGEVDLYINVGHVQVDSPGREFHTLALGFTL